MARKKLPVYNIKRVLHSNQSLTNQSSPSYFQIMSNKVNFSKSFGIEKYNFYITHKFLYAQKKIS